MLELLNIEIYKFYDTSLCDWYLKVWEESGSEELELSRSELGVACYKLFEEGHCSRVQLRLALRIFYNSIKVIKRCE